MPYSSIDVRPSIKAPKAGLAAYATTDLAPGTRFQYFCKLYANDEANSHDVDRSWNLDSDLSCDGSNFPVPDPMNQNPILYVNGASTRDQCNWLNMEVDLSINHEVWYVVTKAIAAGDELWVDYGKQYFKSRGMPYCRKEPHD